MTGSNIRRDARASLLLTASATALLIAAPATAQTIESCPLPVEEFYGSAPLPVTCDVPADAGLTGADASGSSLFNVYDYTLTSEADLQVDVGVQAFGLRVKLQSLNGSGDIGDAGGPGVDGSTISITNFGDIDVSGANGGSTTESFVAIHAEAVGGRGADAPDAGMDGGRGGDGGYLTVVNNGAITLDAAVGDVVDANIHGIFVRSYAGEGGAQDSSTFGLGDQVGGNSGDAKDSIVENHGDIIFGAAHDPMTVKVGANAIHVNAQGNKGGPDNGEGGSGGTVQVSNDAGIFLYLAPVEAFDGSVAGIFARSWGGDGVASNDNSDDGGRGEEGRPVKVVNSGAIYVETTRPLGWGAEDGDFSAGIYAISLGGDGGRSANDSTGGAGGGASQPTSQDSSQGLTSTNIVLQGGSVITQGDALLGILARSLGGDGGPGAAADGGDAHSSIGGRGGDAGATEIDLIGGTVTTEGDYAYGIVGQSVGGEGGSQAATAGAGGGGGSLTVDADAASSISTAGDFAAGVVLHSVGGGGGIGADFTRVLAGSGGTGGNGGDGGSATITSAATVFTNGMYAHGLLAQSIGGGGGSGGVGEGLVVGLGGDGGEGGESGLALVNVSGGVTTIDYGSNAVVAQSISGGGGAAGASGGIVSVGGQGGTVIPGFPMPLDTSGSASVNTAAEIDTYGDASYGVLVQSIGGGGGSASGSAGVGAIGGTGAAGGNAANASIFAVDGHVATRGAFSHGLVAQSIGGGGGTGGSVIDLSVGAGVGVGGDSGAGGAGGRACISTSYDGCVNITAQGGTDKPAQGSGFKLTTEGDFANGAMVQSIGGGGGSGGSAGGVGALDVVSLQIGGKGAVGGDGHVAEMTLSNLALETHGENAHGLVGQSVGGGGGSGGSAAGLGVETVAPIQIGASAGQGGSAQSVDLQLANSSVSTFGHNSVGIVAQAIGGGGGTGGSAYGGTVNDGITFGAAVGGTGGQGGNGGCTYGSAGCTASQSEGETRVSVSLTDVTLVTGEVILPDGSIYGGEDSFGILAQSIGGGGGMGGSSAEAALTAAAPTGTGESFEASAVLSLGGAGGAAGAGYDVDVSLGGASILVTNGDGAHGIVAQSIAHGGGAAGSASALDAVLGDGDTSEANFEMALGNSGGAGGTSRDVTVTVADQSYVGTKGDGANAIVAQSISGGGGAGGVGSGSEDQLGGGFNLTGTVNLGGTGGDGGSVGTVTVTIEEGATVETLGSGSRGILAQAIAGGGGAAQGGTVGLSGGQDGEEESVEGSIGVGVGRAPGNSMVGGTVRVTVDGTITTSGGDADAVLMQSVGGSGGLGGSVANDAGKNRSGGFLGGDEGVSYGLTANIGGGGGTGGDGGAVTATLGGTLQTFGDWSDGLVAQSIGGGGGAGGTSTASGSEATAQIDLAVGGSGGAGGRGGTVTLVTTTGADRPTVSTAGYGAHGVVLQSIGGGGGQGGDGSDSAEGDLTIGGGVGGSAGSSGAGGSVTYQHVSSSDAYGITVRTQGEDAYGFLAQSVGGGGGIGGAGNSEAAEDRGSHQIDVTVGGSAGSSGDGGAVTLDALFDIGTTGDRSFGLVAQSIGGGGGVGGASDSDSLASVTVGGSAGTAGKGGAVQIFLREGSQIATSGLGAHGIVAQSIGGGGGIGGDASGGIFGLRGIDGSSGSNVRGGNVEIFIDAGATVHTTGDRSFGVLVQSIGGGGGISGGAGGMSLGGDPTSGALGGVASVSVSGDVRVDGEESVGVFVQSLGVAPDGTNQTFVEVAGGGSVTGGAGADSAAIMIVDGSDPAVIVDPNGVVSAGDAEGRSIVYRGSGTVAQGYALGIYNDGTVIGDLSLQDSTGATAGTLYNQEGGVFVPSSQIQADVVNAGAVDLVAEPAGWTDGPLGAAFDAPPTLAAITPPAPPRSGIGPVRLDGDFTQTRRGVLRVTGDFDRARMDLLRVSGRARLGGTLLIEPISISPDARLDVIAADGGVRGRFDEVESVLFDFAQRREGGGISIEAVDSHFADPSFGLDAQQASAARYLDGVFDAGGEGFGEFFAGQERLARVDAGAYAQSLTIFAPGATLAPAAANFDRARTRLDAAQACSGPGAVEAGEGRCLRMLGGIERRDQQGDASGAFGYDGSVWTVGLAGQAPVAPGWILGAAAGYEGADYSGDASTSAEGGTGFLAASLRHEVGAWGFGAAAGGSWGDFDLERRLAGATAEADAQVWSLAGRLRADWTMPLPHGWLRPSLDLDVVHSAAEGYTERGAGALNLALGASSETAAMLTPALELGGETPLTADAALQAWVRIGATFSSVDGYGATGRLASANPALGGFRSVVAVADATARLSAGLAVVEADALSVEAVYDGAFADGYSAHGGSLRLTLRF